MFSQFGFGARRKRKTDAKVMLTSMMDMFTIIIVFLLYNFEGEAQQVTVPSDIQVPTSTSEEQLRKAVKVTISPTAILVEDKLVVRIFSGKLQSAQVQGAKILPLYTELRKQKALTEYRIRKEAAKPKEEDYMILLQADRKISYDVLDKVLKSAGMAGYPKAKFVVLRKGA